VHTTERRWAKTIERLKIDPSFGSFKTGVTHMIFCILIIFIPKESYGFKKSEYILFISKDQII